MTSPAVSHPEKFLRFGMTSHYFDCACMHLLFWTLNARLLQVNFGFHGLGCAHPYTNSTNARH